MLLIVDNYDSFTWNLFQMLGALGAKVEVHRNDAITVEEIRSRGYTGIVLSPGPGTPDDSGVCLDILNELEGTLPILGVCLGHQAISQHYGAKIVRAALPVHGKPSDVAHDGTGILVGLPQPFIAGRYHSLVVEPGTLPDILRVNGRTDDGAIMAIEHRDHPTWGVQFHPESILTPEGEQLLANFLDLVEAAC